MATGLGVTVALYVVFTQCCHCIGGLVLDQRGTLNMENEETPAKNQTTELDPLEVFNKRVEEEETSQGYIDYIKAELKRIIKTYRLMKPEIKLAMCFSRYTGIVESENESRAMNKEKEKDKKKHNVVRDLLKGIVHAIMLFLSDFTPQPLYSMAKTIAELWNITRDMYTTMRRDEMGDCSMDYVSNRFWWWLGTV